MGTSTMRLSSKVQANHFSRCRWNALSRAGNAWDNAAMESFFSSLKTECTARKNYQTRNEAKAGVFDCIERIYNPIRWNSTIGCVSRVELERKLGLA